MCVRSLLLCAGLLAPLCLPTTSLAQALPQKFEGITEYQLPTRDGLPGGIVVGSDGALWFQMGKANKIGRITTDGHASEFGIPTQNSSGTLTRPMALGADGAVWFVESEVGQIGRVNTDGQIREFPLSVGSQPSAIASGPDGALWITEYTGNRIARMSLDGQVAEYPIPTPGSAPKGITVGQDQALWFAETDAKAIGRITTTGQVTEFAVPGVDHLWGGIAATPDGAIWFSEGDQTDVGQLMPGGKITQFSLGVSPDVGMTVGPDKSVWFSDNSRVVGRIQSDGHMVGYETPTPGSRPSGITTGPDGALWFTEKSAGQIGRLLPAQAVGECRTHATDVTIPDGSQFHLGDNFNKVWHFANCGTTTWSGYQAVRVRGDFGPASTELPVTAPGQGLDVSMPVQAPEVPGCYSVYYAIQGPRGQFGQGFGFIVDVLDGLWLSPKELEATLLPANSLGDGWTSSSRSSQTRCGEKGGPSEDATGAFEGPLAVAIVDLTQLRSTDAADAAAIKLPQDLPATVDRAPVDGLGDGAAITWATDVAVGYQFRVGMVVARVAAAQSGAGLDDTDALARRIANLQEQQLRDALTEVTRP